MAATLIGYEKRHELPDKEVIPIFCHIYKCGGMSLRNMLMKHYHCCYFGRTLRGWSNRELLAPLNAQRPVYYHSENDYGVHGMFPSKHKVFYFTFLRDPLQKAISLYKFTKFSAGTHAIDPDVFICSQPINPIVRLLGQGDIHLAKSRLFSEFAFFGLVERYNESIEQLCTLLPWLDGTDVTKKNVSQEENVILEESTIKFFMERNSDDIELYNDAREEFNRRYGDVSTKPREAVRHAASDISDDERNKISDQRKKIDNIIEIVSAEQYHRGDSFLPDGSGTAFLNVHDRAKLYNFYINQQSLDCKYYAFLCCLELNDIEKARKIGNEICDAIDEMDRENQVPFLMEKRAEILCELLDRCQCGEIALAFPERRMEWLEALRISGKWCGEVFRIEAKIMKARGDKSSAVARAKKAVEAAPHDYESYVTLFHAFLEDENIAEAIDACKKIVYMHPGNMTYREHLTTLLIRQGNLEDAEAMTLRDIAVFPKLGWPYYQYSRVLEAKNEFSRAYENARTAWAKQPEKRTFAANVAHILRIQGKYAECMEFCDNALERNAFQGWPWRELCRCFEEMGECAKALEYGAKAISVHPDDKAFDRYYDVLVTKEKRK